MSLLAIAVLLAWVAIAIVVWVGYLLVAQNGRLLLRVEGLERHLGELEGLAATDPAAGGEDAEAAWTDGVSQPEGMSAGPIGQPAGTVLHDFELPDLDGRQRLRSDWLGRRMLLTFVNPACPHSRALLLDLAALDRARSPSWPLLVLVSTGSREENRRLVEAAGLTCPVLVQEEMEVGALLEVPATPMAYLVDEDGRTASPLVAGRVAVLGLAAVSSMGPDADVPVEPPTADLVWAATTPAPVNGERYMGGVEVGGVAPDFRLPGLDGDEVALGRYRGRRVLLVFTDPICPPCDELLPALAQVPAGLIVLLVARGSPEANRAWAQRHGLTLPIGLQRHWEISREYGLLATPLAYLIDERGAIAEPAALGTDEIIALLARAGGTSARHTPA